MHGLVMEERMRKVVSVVLCICMLTVMAGCGSEGEKKETAGPSGSLQTPEASEPSAVAPDNPESGEDPDVSQEAYDDSRIIEAVHEELETDQGTIVFCIPNLEDDSPDAEAGVPELQIRFRHHHCVLSHTDAGIPLAPGNGAAAGVEA